MEAEVQLSPTPSLVHTNDIGGAAGSVDGGRPSVEQVRQNLERRVRDLHAGSEEAHGNL